MNNPSSQPVIWIGQDALTLGVVRQALTAAQHGATLLLEGETGVGKELLARLSHQQSSLGQGPFMAMGCGAVPSNLFESELFGHVAGAFTGALNDRMGLLEAADGGTLFLDEISEVPLPLQVKLLRVLQDGVLTRLGENQTRQVKVRVVAATSRNLKELVDQRLFREDLYYRLNVVHLVLPPLRERPQDISLLCDYFAKIAAQRLGQNAKPVAAEAMALLCAYEWPGNVRELANTMEHMVIYSDDPVLDENTLPGSVMEGARQSPTPKRLGLKQRVEMYEKRLIREAMRQAKGVKARAARLLGVKRTTLVLKMQRYGMAQGRDRDDEESGEHLPQAHQHNGSEAPQTSTLSPTGAAESVD